MGQMMPPFLTAQWPLQQESLEQHVCTLDLSSQTPPVGTQIFEPLEEPDAEPLAEPEAEPLEEPDAEPLADPDAVPSGRSDPEEPLADPDVVPSGRSDPEDPLAEPESEPESDPLEIPEPLDASDLASPDADPRPPSGSDSAEPLAVLLSFPELRGTLGDWESDDDAPLVENVEFAANVKPWPPQCTPARARATHAKLSEANWIRRIRFR
jgi:hypothetical protein